MVANQALARYILRQDRYDMRSICDFYDTRIDVDLLCWRTTALLATLFACRAPQIGSHFGFTLTFSAHGYATAFAGRHARRELQKFRQTPAPEMLTYLLMASDRLL